VPTKWYYRALTPDDPPTAGTKSAVLTTTSGYAFTEYALSEDRGSSGFVEDTMSTNNTTAEQRRLVSRFTSPGVAAGTYGAGTWNDRGYRRQSNANAESYSAFSVYFWRPSTSSVVGYVYDSTTQLGTRWYSSNAYRLRGASFTGSDVTVADGDVLVVELWSRAVQTKNTSYTIGHGYNGNTESTNEVTNNSSPAGHIISPADIPLFTGGGGDTVVDAVHASGSGIASNAVIVSAPNAVHSSGSGIASNSSVAGSVSSSVSNSSGNAYGASVSLNASPTAAPATGSALDATTTYGSVSRNYLQWRYASARFVGAIPGLKGIFDDFETHGWHNGRFLYVIAGQVSAEVASGSGTSYNATISILKSVSATLASGTGTAYNTTISKLKSVSAGASTGTGTAYLLGKTLALPVTLLTGVGSAFQAGKTVAPLVGAALGSGLAYNASKSFAINAGNSVGTGVAYATASETVAITGGLGSGTGTAANAPPLLAVGAGQAAGTGSSYNVSSSLAVRAEVGLAFGLAGVRAFVWDFNAADGSALPSGFGRIGAQQAAILSNALRLTAPGGSSSFDGIQGTLGVDGVATFRFKTSLVDRLIFDFRVATTYYRMNFIMNGTSSLQYYNGSGFESVSTGSAFTWTADTWYDVLVSWSGARTLVMVDKTVLIDVVEMSPKKLTSGAWNLIGTNWANSATTRYWDIDYLNVSLSQSSSIILSLNASHSTGTSAAYDTSSESVGQPAAIASGSGSAQNSPTSLAVNAQHSSGVGSALNATVVAYQVRTVDAAVASGVGAIHVAHANVAPPAGHGSGAGSAFQAGKTVASPVGAALGSGLAYNASKTLQGSAGHSTGTGSSQNALQNVAPDAGAGLASGVSHNASFGKGVPIGLATGKYNPSLVVDNLVSFGWERQTDQVGGTTGGATRSYFASGGPEDQPYASLIAGASSSLYTLYPGGGPYQGGRPGVTAGVSYTFTARMRLNAPVARTVRPWCEWKKSDNSHITTMGDYTYSMQPGDWIVVRVTQVAPVDSAYIVAGFGYIGAPGDSLDVTYVSFRESSDIPAISATAFVDVNPVSAVGSGVALSVSAQISKTAVVISGSGSSLNGSPSLSVSVQSISVSGTCYNATVSLVKTATASLASALGFSYESGSEAVGQSAELASGSATAYGAGKTVVVSAGANSGAGSALDASSLKFASGEVASGGGFVFNVISGLNIPAGVAAGTGQALNAKLTLNNLSGVAAGVGQAHTISVSFFTYPKRIVGTGIAAGVMNESDFTGADGSALPSWMGGPIGAPASASILDNALRLTVPGGSSSYSGVTGSSSVDGSARFRFKVSPVNDRLIFDYRVGGSTYSYYRLNIIMNGTVSLQYYNGTGFEAVGTASAFSWSVDTWYEALVVWSSGFHQLVINGTSILEVTEVTPKKLTVGYWQFLGTNWAANLQTRYWDIDDVQVLLSTFVKPIVSAGSGQGSGTGTANAPREDASTTATAALGSGAAGIASRSVIISASLASGTGSASDATVTKLKAVFAEVSSGSGSALAASKSLHASAGVSAGVGASYGCSLTLSSSAPSGCAFGSGDSHSIKSVVGVSAGLCVGAGAVPAAWDSFNRADNASSLGVSDSGHTWEAWSGTWGIESNRAWRSSHVLHDRAVVDLGEVDHEVSVDLLTGPSSITAGVVVRGVDSLNYLLVNLASALGGVLAVYSYVNGAQSTVGMTDIPGPYFNATHRLRVVCRGTQVISYVDDVWIRTDEITQFATTGTWVGMRVYSNVDLTSRFDNFTAFPVAVHVPEVKTTAGMAAGSGAAHESQSETVGQSADVCAGSGSAFTSALSLAVGSSVALGGGDAYIASINASAETNINASVASGAGSSNLTGGLVGAGALVSAGTGSAFLAAFGLGQSAGNAAGSSTELTLFGAVGSNAAHSSGSGSGFDLSSTVSKSAVVSVGSSLAHAPLLSLLVNAGEALGVGTAYQAASSFRALAGTAEGLTNAFDVTCDVTTSGGLGSALGLAQNAPPVIGVSSDTALGLGVVESFFVSLTVSSEGSFGSGDSYAASVGSDINAFPSEAAASGESYNLNSSIDLLVGVAEGSGSAEEADVSLLTHPNSGTSSGLASDPLVLFYASSSAGTGSGSAFNAFVVTSALLIVTPGTAFGVGSGWDSSTDESLDLITGLAECFNPVADVQPDSERSLGIASTFDAGQDFQIYASTAEGWGEVLSVVIEAYQVRYGAAEAGSGSGEASDGSISIGAGSEVSDGLGSNLDGDVGRYTIVFDVEVATGTGEAFNAQSGYVGRGWDQVIGVIDYVQVVNILDVVQVVGEETLLQGVLAKEPSQIIKLTDEVVEFDIISGNG